jgi:hypothetical protein
VLRKPQGTLEVEGVSKYLLSVPERNLPDVVAVHVEQVEKIEPHRHFANQISRRMLHLHAPLQLCEAGDRAVERDNLAIGDERRGFLMMNRFDHFGIFRVQPNSIPRKQIQIATAAKSEAAFPIPFRLKQPSLARKDLIRERRQHGRNPFRLCSISKPGLGVGWKSVEQVAHGHGNFTRQPRRRGKPKPADQCGSDLPKNHQPTFLRLTRRDPNV